MKSPCWSISHWSYLRLHHGSACRTHVVGPGQDLQNGSGYVQLIVRILGDLTLPRWTLLGPAHWVEIRRRRERYDHSGVLEAQVTSYTRSIEFRLWSVIVLILGFWSRESHDLSRRIEYSIWNNNFLNRKHRAIFNLINNVLICQR